MFNIISINPTFENQYGHHFNFESTIKKEVFNAGGDFFVLASKKIDKRYKNDNFLSIFSDSAWEIENPLKQMKIQKRFKNNLFEAIKMLEKKNLDNNIFYMYTASILHIPSIVEATIFLQEKKYCFVLNLFYLHNKVAFSKKNKDIQIKLNKEEKYILQTFSPYLGKLNIYLCSDSQEIIKKTMDNIKVELFFWPFFVLSNNLLEIQQTLNNIDCKININSDDTLVCAYISSSQYFRGYNLLFDLLLKLIQNYELKNFKFLIRQITDDFQKKILKIKKILNENDDYLKIILGELSKEEYYSLLKNSDVILLPYRSNHFLLRTSSVFAEAVLFQKPVIVTKETWAGQITEKLAIGATFKDGDIESFYTALWQIKMNYSDYVLNLRNKSSKWLEDHHPKKFILFLKNFLDESSKNNIRKNTKEEVQNIKEIIIKSDRERNNLNYKIYRIKNKCFIYTKKIIKTGLLILYKR